MSLEVFKFPETFCTQPTTSIQTDDEALIIDQENKMDDAEASSGVSSGTELGGPEDVEESSGLSKELECPKEGDKPGDLMENVQQEMASLLTDLLQTEQSSSKSAKAINLVQKILGKILNLPDNPKFRDLNLSKIHKKLEDTLPAFAMLFIAGFTASADDTRLRWRYSVESIERLNAVQKELSLKFGSNPSEKRVNRRNDEQSRMTLQVYSRRLSNFGADIQSKNMQTMEGGIRFEEIFDGKGSACKNGDKLRVRFVGEIEGPRPIPFDEEIIGSGFEFTLGNDEVMVGWMMGIERMKIGGKRHMIIPQDLTNGLPPTIPRDAMVRYTIKLMAINGVDEITQFQNEQVRLWRAYDEGIEGKVGLESHSQLSPRHGHCSEKGHRPSMQVCFCVSP